MLRIGYVYGLLYHIWFNMCFRIPCHLLEVVFDQSVGVACTWRLVVPSTPVGDIYFAIWIIMNPPPATPKRNALMSLRHFCVRFKDGAYYCLCAYFLGITRYIARVMTLEFEIFSSLRLFQIKSWMICHLR